MNTIIYEFLSNPKYNSIRKVYINHFDDIKIYITKFGRKLSLEDIGNLDRNLVHFINENREFLIELNGGISKNEIQLEHLTTKN